jgi:hypothetical protein
LGEQNEDSRNIPSGRRNAEVFRKQREMEKRKVVVAVYFPASVYPTTRFKAWKPPNNHVFTALFFLIWEAGFQIILKKETLLDTFLVHCL